MDSPPWFPAYDVQVCTSDSLAFRTNSALVRLTFRVKDEELEDVLKTLLPNESIETRKALAYGR